MYTATKIDTDPIRIERTDRLAMLGGARRATFQGYACRPARLRVPRVDALRGDLHEFREELVELRHFALKLAAHEPSGKATRPPGVTAQEGDTDAPRDRRLGRGSGQDDQRRR